MLGARYTELRNWRRLLLLLMDPPQNLVSCQSILNDLMGSLLLVSLVVNFFELWRGPIQVEVR